jgi:hypothetical protein
MSKLKCNVIDRNDGFEVAEGQSEEACNAPSAVHGSFWCTANGDATLVYPCEKHLRALSRHRYDGKRSSWFELFYGDRSREVARKWPEVSNVR